MSANLLLLWQQLLCLKLKFDNWGNLEIIKVAHKLQANSKENTSQIKETRYPLVGKTNSLNDAGEGRDALFLKEYLKSYHVNPFNLWVAPIKPISWRFN